MYLGSGQMGAPRSLIESLPRPAGEAGLRPVGRRIRRPIFFKIEDFKKIEDFLKIFDF